MSLSPIFGWRMKPAALAVVLLAMVGGWQWLTDGAAARGSNSSRSERSPEAGQSSADFASGGLSGANGAMPLGVPSALTLAPAMSGCATPSFAAAASFGAGTSPISVAAGDFNLDGKPDLAVANQNSANVSVRLGNGAGGFGAATNFGAGTNPTSVAVGDFNRDGSPDLAVSNLGSANVSVLLGNGAGGFGAATNFGAGLGPVSVAVGDFNRDGSPDLAVVNNLSENVSVLLGNGAGGFGSATNFGVGTEPFSVASGDFNRDGSPDLAVANAGSNNVSVLLGNGAGSFGAAANFGTGTEPLSVAVGDFNLDGSPDLATANQNSGNVSVLLGNGAGGFGAATNFGAGTQARAVAVGDLNLDGSPDLAVANLGSANVSVLLGNGAGGFGAATNFGAGLGPVSVAVGDFNLDGKPDLATANFGSGNASVLLNTCDGTPCTVTSFDPAANFGTGGSPQSVALGDFNLDGKPDLATANNGTSNVSVLLGNGAGGFSAATNFGVGTNPTSVAAGDFNLDGKLDLAVSNAISDNVSVLLGNGMGGFGVAANFGVGINPASVAVGDFNLDGKPDLATANQGTTNASVLLGNGMGGFGTAANFGVGDAPASVAVGDFNLDGKPDLAVANVISDNVSVLLGNGMGSFSAATNFGVGDAPFSVAVGDFNLDGKPDLATANQNAANASVLLGDGAGGFAAASNFGVGNNPLAVAVGDFNLDGKPDLATANYFSNNISVLLGDGLGSFGTAVNFGTESGPEEVAVGDFNLDGKPDLATANFNVSNVSVLLNNCIVNILPSIMPLATARTEGSPGFNSQIATAMDAEDAENALRIQISNGGAFGDSASLDGVTVTLTDQNPLVTNANPDTIGQVFANVVAACGAMTASFTLRVTDSGGLVTDTPFAVTVNANPMPTLGAYPMTSVTVGANTTVTANVAPADNGTVMSLTASAPGFTGTFSGDPMTGVITVTNAAPPGSYAVTVTAMDNCSLGATTTFNLVVNCVNSLTVNDTGDGADFAPGNGVCETATGNGICTLRAAIQEANALPTCLPFAINFSVTGTINLATALPALNHPNLTINGPGAANLTVARNSATAFRIFAISASRTAAITGLTITNGQAPGTGNGGGILNSGALTLSQCVVSGNTIENSSIPGTALGGGIHSTGPLTIDGCAIAGNTGRNGGGISQIGSQLIITNSSISGNTGPQTGGLSLRNLTANLTNCTISGNTATDPGRISAIDHFGQSGQTSSLTLTNCTLADNTGDEALQTIGDAGVVGVSTQLKNTLVATNNGANFDIQGFNATLTSQGNNLDSDGTSGFTNGANGDIIGTSGSPINALLAPPGNHGGSTATHALLPGSPAINAGDNCVAQNPGCLTTPLTTDQRGAGFNRQVGGTVDIGAFESRGFALSISGGDNQTTPPTAPFPNPLLVNVASSFGEPVAGGMVTFTPPGSGPSATLAGNPATISGAGQASVTATANNQQGAYQVAAAASGANTVNFTLTNQCPALGLSAPGGTAGTPYNQAINGAPPSGNYSFVQTGGPTGGMLPPGLTLMSDGSLTGTPAMAGSFTFQVQATGYGGACVSTHGVTIVVNCPAITLSPQTLPNAQINTAYPQTITAAPAGGNYSFAVTSGLLPAGLTLNSNGSFSGAPAQSGVFNFRVTATGFGSCSGFADYVLLVNCATITVNPASLPGGTVGTAYSQTVSASPAGTYSYSVSSGALLAGLTLNGSTGAITGTPATTGSFSFTITATAGSCSGSRTYSVTIACPVITLSPGSPLPGGPAGVVYSQTISVSPAGSYTFSLISGSLPSGLTLNPATGVISGLPSTVGSFTFTVKAQTASGCNGTQTYTLAIVCPTVTLSPASVPSGATGTTYSQTISASPSGGSYTYAVTVGSLPTGLNLNSATGVLSGTPTTAGLFTFRVTGTGFGGCTGFRDYTVVIGGGGCPAITLPASQPNGSVGTLYNSSAAASPSGLYNYTATGSLPPGITLYSFNGLIFGYPNAAGSYTFTITATAGACSGSKTYTVLVGAGFASSLTVFSDFDGDGKSDLSVFRGSDGNWLVANSGDGQLQATAWGSSASPYNDVTVSGDYDGDGKTDLAVFRRGGEYAGYWFIKRSSDGEVSSHFWGLPTDIPVPGDYDADGKTDVAVWRGSAGAWYIVRSSDGGIDAIVWGLAAMSDIPVPGDYDGDGKTDVAVFRKTDGYWYIRRSSDGLTTSAQLGVGTDVLVPGDYDGDNRTDIAVWRASEGNWYIVESGSAVIRTVSSGAAAQEDVPVVADYDGDGKADAALWRASTGTWMVKRSSDGAETSKAHGQSGDTPIMARRN